eukprot:GHVU01126412.1.p1 GENE.GHVU01126412.1~~GHVU01126412.1.p1  ORF type:complete len:146 (-),score=33.88 GHVU01126412.1:620-1057(-)
MANENKRLAEENQAKTQALIEKFGELEEKQTALEAKEQELEEREQTLEETLKGMQDKIDALQKENEGRLWRRGPRPHPVTGDMRAYSGVGLTIETMAAFDSGTTKTLGCDIHKRMILEDKQPCNRAQATATGEEASRGRDRTAWG